MSESGQLATFPGEVALEPGRVEGAEEEETVGDHREFVDVSHLYWVLCFDHFYEAILLINYKEGHLKN